MNNFIINSSARSGASRAGLFSRDEYHRVSEFHRTRSQSKPTPLLALSGLARKLGLGTVLVKDESTRFGLNAFKVAGVEYAVHCIAEQGLLAGKFGLACATDGNHGRAVAHVARKYGLSAKIYVHSGASLARIRAIQDEGAEVVVVNGNYDDAVRWATRNADPAKWVLVSDTSWPGYEAIPRLIMAGYTWIIDEAAKQWIPAPPPDVVIVQVGVGGLLCAMVSWLIHRYGPKRPLVIACEPTAAACLLESVRAGHPVAVKGPLSTIMAGLSTGEVSFSAWPIISSSVDVFVAIEDERSASAMRMLANPVGQDVPVIAGESGASGLAALTSVLGDRQFAQVRDFCEFSPRSRVLILNTEGATDPESYFQIVGRQP
jgi:diaminopropionate ammonia-lyase